MATARTFYEILNVSPDAELVVIEAAYRALMKKYHPDQGGGAANGPSASEINSAYAVLRDPQRRAEYDQKEWIRQRDIQLAAYQPPPPPRRSNFFGWGGWLVAFVLAGMIALMASREGGTMLSAAEQARVSSAPVDLHSQPVSGGQPAVSDAEMAEIRAAAFARRPKDEEQGRAAATPSAAKAVPAPAAIAAPPPAPAMVAAPAPTPVPVHRPAYARRHPLAHRHGTTVAQRRDKDFLERQGYIY